MEIKRLDNASKDKWDLYVDSQPDATFFHKAGWRDVIEKAFDHNAYFLYAEEDGQIVGVLPLGHVNSFLFGNALVSTPFCVYGGIVSDSEQARTELNACACQLARELAVDHLELRNIRKNDLGRPVKELYVTFRKSIDSDSDKNLLAIPRKQRAMVRKGIAAGLSSIIDPDMDRFYNIYAESVRNLGTPVFSKKLFCVLREVFGEACEVISVEHKGRVVSSVMNFYFRDEVLPYYGGGIAEARDLYANDFMYWEVMRRAAIRGIQTFDFGRSKVGTGSYRFKIHWGFEPQPLYYEYDLVRSDYIPDINPLNPKFQIFIAAWKRLPLPVSKLIGPMLARNLG